MDSAVEAHVNKNKQTCGTSFYFISWLPLLTPPTHSSIVQTHLTVAEPNIKSTNCCPGGMGNGGSPHPQEHVMLASPTPTNNSTPLLKWIHAQILYAMTTRKLKLGLALNQDVPCTQTRLLIHIFGAAYTSQHVVAAARDSIHIQHITTSK